MQDFDRDQPPFTNGTEYEIWQGAWCLRCVHEHDEFGGPCDDFAIPALLEDRTPEILIPGPSNGSGRWTCTKFEPRTG